jgi:hypothetical protein
VVVGINFTDELHTKAEATPGPFGSYDVLQSGSTGPATILWREFGHIVGSATLGVQWAYVLLDRGDGGGEIFTAHIDSSIPQGAPDAPTQGQGEVWRVKAGGVTESLGVKQLYNPFVAELSGECTVDNIEGDDHLIVGVRGSVARAVVRFTATVSGGSGDPRVPATTSSYTVQQGSVTGPLQNWSTKEIPNGFYGPVMEIGGFNVILDAWC